MTVAISTETNPLWGRATGVPGANTTAVHHWPATSGATAANAMAGTSTAPGARRSLFTRPPNQRVKAAMMTAAGSALPVTYPAPHAEFARFPVIASNVAACASNTANTLPTARVQNRSPARRATHHTTPSITGRKTTYGANGHRPRPNSGVAPDHPTSASSPVGSSTICTAMRTMDAHSATRGRRFVDIHTPSCGRHCVEGTAENCRQTLKVLGAHSRRRALDSK